MAPQVKKEAGENAAALSDDELVSMSVRQWVWEQLVFLGENCL